LAAFERPQQKVSVYGVKDGETAGAWNAYEATRKEVIDD
jgi:hypothetical protein